MVLVAGLGDHERLGEVLEALDHPDEHREEDHRGDHRQGHVAERLPRPGPLQLGRLVQLPGHVQQRGQEDDHHLANAPQADQGQARLGPARVHEPQRLGQVQQPQDAVDRPGRVEDVDEPERGRHQRHHGGQEEDRPVERQPALDPGQDGRRGDAEQHLERDQDGHDPQRVLDRHPEQRVAGEHEPVVGQAHPFRLAQDVVLGEGEVQAGDHRVHVEDAEPDDPRRHEGEGDQLPSPGRASPPPATLGQAGLLGGGRPLREGGHVVPPTPAAAAWRSAGRAGRGRPGGRGPCPPATSGRRTGTGRSR